MTPTAPSPTPFGDVGPETGRSRCKCGAGRHDQFAEPGTPGHERCANGHPWVGCPGPALVTGARSTRFWQEHETARRELREAIIVDAGADPDDAPEALRLAADSIAQATLIRDSAYQHLVESGGPLTSSGRARRAFDVWLRAQDRLERHLRLVGLERKAAPVPSLEQELQRLSGGRS